MSETRQATVCLFASRSIDTFRQTLGSMLRDTPMDHIELRLAFSQAADSLAYAVGVLAPDGAWLKREGLPDDMERFEWRGTQGLCIRAWSTSRPLSRDEFGRLMVRDVPLATEYAVFLDSAVVVEAGWWQALEPLFEQRIDTIGRSAWRDYLPGEVEQVQRYPWYMGVPAERREGRPGVSYMAGGFVAIRAERLRQANYPEAGFAAGSDVLLGAAAHQLRWTRASRHDRHKDVRDA
jgi:hypothetical protein